MRSKTTRRSAPITRSRFRKPTSKSTTTTFCPASASAAPKAAVEVVLPTPPLPDVTTSTLAINASLLLLPERRDHQCLTIEPRLSGPGAKNWVKIVGGPIDAVYGQQFRFDFAAEDS